MAVRVIVGTLVLLSLVNAYSFVKLYSSTFVPDKSFSRARTPAAIQPAQVLSQSIQEHLQVDLNCGAPFTAELKVKSQYAQLKGRVCKKKKGHVVVEITNLNNGFTASVFELGPDDYQTDLIQLNQGANKIRVRFVSPRGSVEEQMLVIQSG